MKTIYKYVIPEITDDQTIRTAGLLDVVHVAPTMAEEYYQGGGELLTSQELRAKKVMAERLTFWAMVDTEAPEQDTIIHIAGTGHPLPTMRAWRHCGSAVMPSGLVWHLFIPDNDFRIELQ